MQDLKELKEAVKIVKEISMEEDCEELIPGRMGTSELYNRYEGKKLEAINTLIDLAQSVIDCEGMPEKKEIGNDAEAEEGNTEKEMRYQKKLSFNEALDLCTLAHVKLMQEKMLTVEEIVNIILDETPIYGSAEWNPMQEQYQVWLAKGSIDSLAQAIHQAAKHKAGKE